MYSTMRQYADETRKLEASQYKYGGFLTKWSLLGLVLSLTTLLCVLFFGGRNTCATDARRRLVVDDKYLDFNFAHLKREVPKFWMAIRAESKLEKVTNSWLHTKECEIVDLQRWLRRNCRQMALFPHLVKEGDDKRAKEDCEAMKVFVAWFDCYRELVWLRRHFSNYNSNSCLGQLGAGMAKKTFAKYFSDDRSSYNLKDFAEIFQNMTFSIYNQKEISVLELIERVVEIDHPFLTKALKYILSKIVNNKKQKICKKFGADIKKEFQDPQKILEYYDIQPKKTTLYDYCISNSSEYPEYVMPEGYPRPVASNFEKAANVMGFIAQVAPRVMQAVVA